MPSTRSRAATKCISEVPGLVKQTSTPPSTRVRTRLSAPFMVLGVPSLTGSSLARRPGRPVTRILYYRGAAGATRKRRRPASSVRRTHGLSLGVARDLRLARRNSDEWEHMTFRRLIAAALAGSVALTASASAESVLRIAMTASDIPTTTGMPNNGFEGMRFLGYPIFEGLVQWDLKSADKLAGLRAGLAERWEQDKDDKKTWIFHLRRGVKFHDGTDFTADAVIWNLERYFNKDSAQFEPPASGISRARVPIMDTYKKIDDYTVAITTKQVASYFPYMAVYLLFTSPASFEKAGKDWAKVATLPAAGTGPFRITKIIPREAAELARHDGYWDVTRKAKVDGIRLIPLPEPTSRLAALRSGQVDWIEVPPPDGIPSIKAAGFNIVTNSYPHVWPWLLNMSAANSPLKDVRVRQGLNYCVDRAR